MGLLYLDATGNWTDPASTTLKYLNAEGQYVAPNMDQRFFDANGEYSVPELSKLSGMTWKEVSDLADKAARKPQDYAEYLGEEKKLIVGGYVTTARIVDIGRQYLGDGSTGGFVFNIYKGMPAHVYSSSMSFLSLRYDQSAMYTWLDEMSRASEVYSYLQTMYFRARPTPTGSSINVYDNFALMSGANVFTGAEDSSSKKIVYSEEGPQYQYFAGITGVSNTSRIHYDNNGQARYAHLLSIESVSQSISVGDYGYNGQISDGGRGSYYYAAFDGVPAIRFCLGSNRVY